VAGGAVFNGAISTIIGISTLSLSLSQIFISFFKVMFLVSGINRNVTPKITARHMPSV
jgi:hypothetical protein